MKLQIVILGSAQINKTAQILGPRDLYIISSAGKVKSKGE